MAHLNIKLEHKEVLIAIIEYVNNHYNLEPLYNDMKPEYNVKIQRHGDQAISAEMKCKV